VIDPSTDKRKRAAIYRSAAKAFEENKPGWGGCMGIDYACEALDVAGADSEELCLMKAVFAPRRDSIAWLELRGLSESDSAQRDFRILALCFMAAMVEAGDA
jgi:hypothetical protein